MGKTKASLKLYRIASGRFPIFDGGELKNLEDDGIAPVKRRYIGSGSVACCRLEILANIEGFRVPRDLICIEIAVLSDNLIWDLNYLDRISGRRIQSVCQ